MSMTHSSLILGRHSRRFAPRFTTSLSHSLPAPLSAKSHQIISFADPHPLNPLESYRFKNEGGGPAFLCHPERGARRFRPCRKGSAFSLSPYILIFWPPNPKG